jgi:hypothetical protein
MDVVLISPVSPFGPPDGYRLAVLSDVHAILDNRLRLGLITFSYSGEGANVIEPVCPVKTIHARRGGGVSRFMRGIFTGSPPSAERLYSRAAYQEIRAALLAWSPQTVIIGDASVSGYMPMIRDVLPRSKVVVRSHNVMHDVRLEQLGRSSGLMKQAVRFDCSKYLELERKAACMCDAHWAITTNDAARMSQLYQRPTQCLTVSVPLENYAGLRSDQGCRNGFVHVGTLDFRRRSDLDGFLQEGWPKVLCANPAATLTLAGSLYGKAIPARNVTYSGRVASDADVYRLGRFALNFQASTGGVKLKTLTSLAAGRSLISTPAGVEGLPLESGQHYWDVNEFLTSPQLRTMLQDVCALQSVADAGRQYVLANHSRAAVARELRTLFEAI